MMENQAAYGVCRAIFRLYSGCEKREAREPSGPRADCVLCKRTETFDGRLAGKWVYLRIAHTRFWLKPYSIAGRSPLVRLPVHEQSLCDVGCAALAALLLADLLEHTGDEQPTLRISTIEFAYTKPSSDQKVRSLNPLGFRIVEYRRRPAVTGQP